MHLVPTRTVADSFGAISIDNRRILVMEWIAEGITHTSLGLLVVLTTAVDGAADATTQLVYVLAAGVLVVLAVLTAATGARTPKAWFRICPFVLTTSAALLVVAAAG
jgi:hypothetical protein